MNVVYLVLSLIIVTVYFIIQCTNRPTAPTAPTAPQCGVVVNDCNKQPADKFLILGSAPYAKEWVNQHLDWFVTNGYRILPMNNAHKLVPPSLVYEWHKPSDYSTYGSFHVNSKYMNQMQSIVTHCHDNFDYIRFYKNHKGEGTMMFNVLYYLLRNHEYPITVVIVGSDLVYHKQGDTFYSMLPGNKARNDPINKYTDVELNEELQHVHVLYKQRNHLLLNGSDQTETRLPFDRFTAYL